MGLDWIGVVHGTERKITAEKAVMNLAGSIK